MLEIGAFPFLFKKEKLHIMLITNTAGSNWLLPKGHPEEELKKIEVAELETYEEAGIKGLMLSHKLGEEFSHKEDTKLKIYPLMIKTILTESKWPEENKRKRQLVTLKEALELVTKENHRAAIKHFSSEPCYSLLYEFYSDYIHKEKSNMHKKSHNK